MTGLNRFKKYPLAILFIFLFIYLGNMFCEGSGTLKSLPEQAEDQTRYAGSASCKNCHKDIYDAQLLTAHYMDSRPALEKFIKGSFKKPKNRFRLNKFTEVVMNKTDSGFFQSAFINDILFRQEAFGMVIGSGRKGQSYLYWDGGRMFQLPVSYFTPLNSWCNSPGYNNLEAYFNKAISGRCIECHSTYAKTTIDPDGVTRFDSSSIIYGIDCERCHGPSAAHVEFHLKNPNEKQARFVIDPKSLSRERRMDACALCHSGFRKEKLPPFSFLTGDQLDDFSTPDYKEENSSTLDVHGNQFGLLTSSKCFKSSRMDCSSCHDTHHNEVNNTLLFSSRCMNCHKEHSPDACTFNPPKGLILSNNCVDCHMPLLASRKIFLQMDDPQKSTADLVRTHRIAIYPDITKKFLKSGAARGIN
ncbi:MAG TPA: multiheme c-type cytochrome [Puia sp.]